MRPYYPTVLGCNPIHEVRDWCKVRNLVRAVRRGDVIPPIVIDAIDGNMLNGTHRAAANMLLRRLDDADGESIKVVTIDDINSNEELLEAVSRLDYETIDDILDK